jgi:transcriptional regulator with XRE-family HTH domain
MRPAGFVVVTQGANRPLAPKFIMCEPLRMDIRALRKDLGLSQEAFATRLGLRSKGHVCELEAGKTPSIRVAIEIEKVSGGRLLATDLNADVALVAQHLAANDTAPARKRAA